ncbi:MAG TPA: hypothetical protein VLQ93_03595 [Myxococcaceae bacterium]|nr:hypothetical protein [Myxococcaceae bacterium]
MAIEMETGATLPFDRFWDWLQDHPNCILSVATDDSWLYDAEALHWALFSEESGTPVVQLIQGKRLIGEMVLDTSDTLHVQVLPDPENLERGYFLFKVMGGVRAAPRPRYTFQLSHGMESLPVGHVALKH